MINKKFNKKFKNISPLYINTLWANTLIIGLYICCLTSIMPISLYSLSNMSEEDKTLGRQITANFDALTPEQQTNVLTLYTTGSCTYCDLEGVIFTTTNLTTGDTSSCGVKITNGSRSKIPNFSHARLKNAQFNAIFDKNNNNRIIRHNCEQADFSGADLENTEFKGANLKNSRFSLYDSTTKKYITANLKNTHFGLPTGYDAQQIGSVVQAGTRSALILASQMSIDTTKADTGEVTITTRKNVPYWVFGAYLPNGGLIETQDLHRTLLMGADFKYANLEGAHLDYALMWSDSERIESPQVVHDVTEFITDLSYAHLKNSILDHALLGFNPARRKNFEEGNNGSWIGYQTLMKGADLSGAQAEKTDFTNALLVGAQFNDFKGPFATFDHALIVVTNFTNAQLNGANFSYATLSGNKSSTPSGTIITKTKMVGANLTGAIFNKSKADYVDFTNANLQKATFCSTSFTDSYFYNVKYLPTTNCCPSNTASPCPQKTGVAPKDDDPDTAFNDLVNTITDEVAYEKTTAIQEQADIIAIERQKTLLKKTKIGF